MNNNYDVVCFGEVLWDILDDKKMPGGAPMNVAYHINRQGFKGGMISAVGADENGKNLLAQLSQLSIPVDFIQEQKNHATSTVIASRKTAEEMQYDILHPVAWDFITNHAALTALSHTTKYFVFGSLVARDSVSQQTLLELLAAGTAVNVFDMNLRSPHYSWALIEQLLAYTHILKLNEDEYGYIKEQLQIDENDMLAVCSLITSRYNIQTIIITRGGDGVVVFHQKKVHEHQGFKIQVADTIGSGDAFLAGFLIGLLQQKSMDDSIYFASQMGAFIATQSGGCPAYTIKDVMAIQ